MRLSEGLTALIFVSGFALACGSSQPAPSAPEAPVPLPSPEPSAPEPAVATPTEEAAEANTEAAEPAPATPPEPTAEKQRDVKYVVSPEGLRVLVEGIAFTPKAEAVRAGGGWGVKVTVEARSDDEAVHSLLAPQEGEVAFAAEVRRANEEAPERFSDRRESDRDLEVRPGKPVKLSRTWPAKGGATPLALGDTLLLDIGIWGLGRDSASRRPLNKLARVELKFDKGKPRVKVMAPEGISK